MINRAYKEAESLHGELPSGSYTEVGRQDVGVCTFIYYEDEDGKLWYISDRQQAFIHQMQAAKNKVKKKALTTKAST